MTWWPVAEGKFGEPQQGQKAPSLLDAASHDCQNLDDHPLSFENHDRGYKHRGLSEARKRQISPSPVDLAAGLGLMEI